MNDGKKVQCDDINNFGYDQSLKRVLGLGAIVFYGLAYVCPFSFFSTYGIMAHMSHGMLAIAYTITCIAMFFTALSYVHMVKEYPIAGSAYSYVQRGLHPHIGFITGWAILMDYLLLPMVNFLTAGLFLKPIFPNVPTWVWIVLYVLLCTIINIVGIELASWVNNVLAMIQLIFIVAVLLFLGKWIATGNGTATFVDLTALYNSAEIHKSGVGWATIFTTCSVLAMTFLGFDAVTTLVEEVKNPQKVIGKGIVITCLGSGAIFVILAYFSQLAWPGGWHEFSNIETGATELIAKVAGSAMAYIFTAIECTALMAAALAAQASASRILFGMGRDSVLPKKIFAYVHPKFKTPVFNTVIIGLIGLTAIILTLEEAANFISFGALFGFALVNLSVITHFYIRKKKHSSILDNINYLIFPIMGTIITSALWLSLSKYAKILGFTWMAIGIIYLAFTTNFFKKLPPTISVDE